MIADGAYDSASVYQAASLRQRDPPADIVIPPRASSVVGGDNADTSTARDRHVQYVAEKGRMAWQTVTGYGSRSLVETAIGRYKHGIGTKLRARSADRQQGEVAIAVSVFNRMIRTTKPVSVRQH
ncbi:hypothetical protein HN018_24800 (plasmid) [Lichenicola cladoniae]|uniref:Transposase n=1 Tax=Lichenicola cladoniae TaxID=1484109 RepID=A0A6M8HYI5_9PROT|nr:hypothetical protein [Lichenicola cladoniae]NPD70119.1 hypothetical protein [Acetobacteraceae bacterium]QKE93410.1 hypothetical protein HN018_24800 [Lichenicola cladoniae]